MVRVRVRVRARVRARGRLRVKVEARVWLVGAGAFPRWCGPRPGSGLPYQGSAVPVSDVGAEDRRRE